MIPRVHVYMYMVIYTWAYMFILNANICMGIFNLLTEYVILSQDVALNNTTFRNIGLNTHMVSEKWYFFEHMLPFWCPGIQDADPAEGAMDVDMAAANPSAPWHWLVF